MEKRQTKKIINSLMDLPEFEPERAKVKVTRLNMVFELQELPYDKLVKLSREADANIHLILACVCNHPEMKRPEWYHDKKGCATPADALKSCSARARWTKWPGPSTSCMDTGPEAWSP